PSLEIFERPARKKVFLEAVGAGMPWENPVCPSKEIIGHGAGIQRLVENVSRPSLAIICPSRLHHRTLSG
ncbi:MAG: hypothetical protein V5B78_04910, partial [Desulfohalobiaceae bacterium]